MSGSTRDLFNPVILDSATLLLNSMAVHEYLTSWNLTRLCDQFKGTSLTRFLSISHTTAVQQYGEDFACHHQRLCDKLRTALYSKRLADKRDATTEGSVKSCTADECLLALTSGIETMCVSGVRDSDKAATVPASPEPRDRALPQMPRTPIKSRLGPLPPRRTPIKMRRRSQRRHRRRFIEHHGVRRNLNAAFQAESEYCTPRANRYYAFNVPRAPVKDRLGIPVNTSIPERVFSQRYTKQRSGARRRLDF